MIVHEGRPSLSRTRWRGALGHAAGNGDLRYLDAQLEHFTVNSRSTPTDIQLCHLSDQPTNFHGDSRSARTTLSTLPPPEEPEPLVMPSQDGGWLHHSQTFPPAIPEAGEQGPEDTVNGPKLGPRSSMYQARELVAQCNILGDEICTVFENGSDR